MIIRLANLADAVAVAEIYGHHVLHSLGTFEETPPSARDIAGRMDAVLAYGLPYLVAEDGGPEGPNQVIGFAYAAPFRPRAAYRYTVEDSVYVSPDAMGRGVGKTLVSRLIFDCEAMGLRQMIAVIGDSANAGSIGLHRALGFTPLGVARGVGSKHGRWVDVVWMQRALNGGEATPPEGAGLMLGGG